MLKPLILWGASGHAKVLREFAGTLGYQVIATFDNSPQTPPPFADVPLFFGEAGFFKWRTAFPGDRIAGAVAIGGGRGLDRLSRQQFFAANNVEIISMVHPTAFVAENARLGLGCQVLAQAAVGVEVCMGEGCIVNTKASIDHECVLGEGVHVAPGATLAGCVEVGRHAFIAIGATVLPRVHIGAHSVVGAGAVVTRDLPAGVVAYGSPARIVRTVGGLSTPSAVKQHP